jgi:membrane protease subunit HflK
VRWLVLLGAVAALAGYVWLGTFSVAPDEQAVVLRLGRYDRTLGPGRYQFYLPGVERYEKRSVTALRDVEFGFRSAQPGQSEAADHPEERLMITTDENLVDVAFVVRYRIGNLRDFLFNLREPELTIRDASASAIRSVVARFGVDAVLRGGRERIEQETAELLRRILDSYGAGVRVVTVQLQDVEPPDPVKDAFAEVTSAEQEGQRLVVEAQGYAEKVVPEARGRAQELLAQARAYRQARTLRARGEVERFEAVRAEYERAPEVTRQRLYLETLEEVLPRMEKLVLDQGQADKLLPYLPIAPRKGAAP